MDSFAEFFAWILSGTMLIFVPAVLVQHQSQSIYAKPITQTGLTKRGLQLLKMGHQSFLVFLAITVLSLVPAFLIDVPTVLGRWITPIIELTIILGLAGMVLSFIFYYGIVYICFTRYSLRTLMVVVLYVAGMGTGISSGPTPLKIICIISLLLFLICGILVLRDHDPKHREKRS